MNIHEYRFLLSERGTLQKMVSETSAGNVFGRMSLQSRLEEVEEQLKAYEGFSPRLVNAVLTFRGRPVIESRGIYADFGTEATNAFADVVTRICASWRSPLSSSGPIPRSDDYRLLITGTATGSFGFQVEDASQQAVLEGESAPVELAIKKVKEILEASVGNDEELVEAIAETDRRALDSVQAFLKKMADNSAVCSLEFQGDSFRFLDVAQVRRSENRLSNDNIQENDVILAGQFHGYLPTSRRAEFYISHTEEEFLREAIGTVIFGKVEASAEGTININEILNKDVNVNAQTRRVGQGRPRYAFADWQLTT